MDPDLHERDLNLFELPQLPLDLPQFPSLLDIAERDDAQSRMHFSGLSPPDRVDTRRESLKSTTKAQHDRGFPFNHRRYRDQSYGSSVSDDGPATQLVPDHELPSANECSYPSGVDLWQPEVLLRPFANSHDVHSWSAFQVTGQQNVISSVPECLSEACSSAFDVALEQYYRDAATGHEAGRSIHSDVLLKSLCQLGIGRSSVLFPLTNTGLFGYVITNGRLSGTSSESVSELAARFLSLGNTVVALRHYAEIAYGSGTAPAAEITLAKSIGSVLDAVEEYVTDQQSECHTLLALDLMFEALRSAIFTMKELVETALKRRLDIGSGSLGGHPPVSGVDLLDAVFHFAMEHDEQGSLISEICRGTLANVAEPWLEALGKEAGLRFRDQALGHRRKDENDISELPRFFNQTDRVLYCDMRQAMACMSSNAPVYVETASRCSDISAPVLKWCFDWGGYENIELRCRKYEERLIEAIGSSSYLGPPVKSSSMPFDDTCHSTIESPPNLASNNGDYLSESIRVLNGPLHDSLHGTQDVLRNRLLVVLREGSESKTRVATPLMPIPLSLTPSLTVCSFFRRQCYIFSHMALHSILRTHNLKGHIQSHRAFSLFGSGNFAFRLSRVLFSLDLESSERQKGKYRVHGTVGLNLSNNQRKNWPPASSELCLALMGILNDCWAAELRSHQVTPTCSIGDSTEASRHSAADTILPGELAFSIRKLPTEDVAQIIDPHSLHALDFLRLSAAPPAPIEHVLTPYARDNYDQCFSLLLRMLRVKFVVTDQIPRDLRHLDAFCGKPDHIASPGFANTLKRHQVVLHRTQHAAHYFASTILSHFIHTTINKPMCAFETYIEKLEACVCSPVPNTSGGLNGALPSISKLAAEHDRTTAAIAAGLFTCHRQQKVGTALSECLEDILLQSRCVRSHIESLPNLRKNQTFDNYLGQERNLPSPMESYSTFISHVLTFTDECRNLAQMSSPGQPDEGATSAAELLSRLDGDWIERSRVPSMDEREGEPPRGRT